MISGLKNGSTLVLFGKFLLAFMAVLWAFFAAQPAFARDGSDPTVALERYVIQLQDPPLAEYDGRELSVARLPNDKRLAPTATHFTGRRKLNTRSAESRAYLGFIAERHQEFRHEAAVLLGRSISPIHRYRIATNGFAFNLSHSEAAILAESPLVRSLARDTKHSLETYAGPKWLGAAEIWTGAAVFSEKRGEGIVIGVIDSGINWDHPSFDNPSPDGYIHSNPLGEVLGLCKLPASGAKCNEKLIGVYDFVEDDPSTDDAVEENTNGRDVDGHGSHTASIAAGNPVDTALDSQTNVTVSGVAPRANIITYRVCFQGDCLGSAILSAIDQAIEDGVDVINYSIGISSFDVDPWQESVSRAYLNARAAGIFVATSAGNSGPDEGTVGSPANAPWVIGVGNATHNSLRGNGVKNLVGGDNTPPNDLFGASLTEGIGQTKIVHARDYGNALCGTGEPELQPACNGNQGLSNPWDGEQPFNGEIVVCDRGIYGRAEKGKNLLLAGAGGYILANTEEFGEVIVADDHCLPASHVGQEDGDTLRAWLAGGSGHGGTITDYSLVEKDSLGDQLDTDSSRGPANSPVEDTLKPNLIAPGVSILAASYQDQQFANLSGTSMASPHVAGSAALLKSVHPDWSVSQIASAIEMTATAELATDRGIDAATPQERGAGRPQLGEAANAGLYLDVTAAEFDNADPAKGGQPKALNLPGLVDANCQIECSFLRRVTDQMGGGNWTATAIDFPEGVQVAISPENFSLGSGQTRELEFDIDVSQSSIIGDWVSGVIRLSATGSSDQFLTVTVQVAGGDLPQSWQVRDERNGGWQEFSLSGLVGLPDATFTTVGLTRPFQATLVEDPTEDDPYDGQPGVVTTWHSLPQGGSWLYVETLNSTAVDLDLFVGRDENGNGRAEESEELCHSTSPNELEMCNLYDLPPGEYWILVQNWFGTVPSGDLVTLAHAASAPTEDNNLAVSGPGITAARDSFPLRVSWDNVNALPGERFFGAVSIGTSSATPNNIGIIPVRFTRDDIAAAETFPLMNGTTHRLALDASDFHDRLFIDVPPGTSSLTVNANGSDEDQNNGLTLELKRLTFDEALSVPPFATPAGNAPILVSATGVGGVGPSITVIGVEPGRWYAVLRNSNDSPSAIEIRANVAFQGAPVAARPGLWEPSSRPGLSQGYEYNQSGSSRALIWYTYDEDGLPAWYIADNPATLGNIWTADLLRFTNDGTKQQSVPVGQVSITSLAENDAMFSYTLYGQSGTERMMPISPLTCPRINGSTRSYTGLWYRGVDGLGGASILVNAETQSQIHYLYDDSGMPRWLFAQDMVNPQPTNGQIPMFQYHGYCAVCADAPVGYDPEPVGMLERSFNNDTTGSWTLDYLFKPPLSGSANRTDSICKRTDTRDCQ